MSGSGAIQKLPAIAGSLPLERTAESRFRYSRLWRRRIFRVRELTNDGVWTGSKHDRTVGRRRRKLAALYERATVLVYPSLYEGFGMPILEAMAHGCPVVAAKTSSIPEVGGDAVEYFDPESSASLGEALMSIIY